MTRQWITYVQKTKTTIANKSYSFSDQLQSMAFLYKTLLLSEVAIGALKWFGSCNKEFDSSKSDKNRL